MMNLAVLGCTGSIGKTTLGIVRKHPDLFRVVFLANNRDEKGLISLAKEFGVKNYFCAGGLSVKNGKEAPFDPTLLSRAETYENVDAVINGIAGLSGLLPTLAAIDAGKIVATANKESIVCAGNYINARLASSNAELRPIDSEHSTVWQCMGDKNNVRKIILTASGGAFRDYAKEQLFEAKAGDALKHPNWIMGKKVTVDCATLVNKGMEIIEAKRLFGIEDVDAVMHRESIIHSLVEMKDGTMIAGLSTPNMEIPIQYALTYPERKEVKTPFLDLIQAKKLSFGQIDEERFPCFTICKDVSCYGDYAGTVLNAANEVAVEKYLSDEIGFYDIYRCIEKALEKFGKVGTVKNTEEIFRIDNEVREYTLRSIKEF